MRKAMLASLTVTVICVCTNPAIALRWPTNAGVRVQSMGNATLGIEDETTALTIFNHQNVAGRAFDEKKNRLDYGLNYYSQDWKLDFPTSEWELKYGDIGAGRPGGEYQGLACWLDENTVVQASVEGSAKYISDRSASSAGEWTDQLKSYLYGGGISAAYKLDIGLALGAAVSYLGANAKPDSLLGSFNLASVMWMPGGMILAGATTTKFEVASSDLYWRTALAYEVKNLGGDDKLTLGLGVSGEDTSPGFGVDAGTYLVASADILGSYNGTVVLEGNDPVLGDVSSKRTLTQMPVVVDAEAIYDLGGWLSAGLLFDYLMNEYHRKVEYQGFDALAPSARPVNTDQKTKALQQWGITPVVRGKIAVAEDVVLLPGLSYSTWGSGNGEYFLHDPTFADPNATYKNSTSVTNSGSFAVGIGVQTLGKQFQGALQYENSASKSETERYDLDGNSLGKTSSEGGIINNFRVGAEFLPIPELAVRAGYALLQTTYKDGAMDNDGNVVDLKLYTGRISAGVGAYIIEGMNLDLLVIVDNKYSEPKSSPEPQESLVNILLGVHMEL
ncbi:MAG: hypothetical protein AB1439_07795 [candidate division FCPU426 bacterium]